MSMNIGNRCIDSLATDAGCSTSASWRAGRFSGAFCIHAPIFLFEWHATIFIASHEKEANHVHQCSFLYLVNSDPVTSNSYSEPS